MITITLEDVRRFRASIASMSDEELTMGQVFCNAEGVKHRPAQRVAGKLALDIPHTPQKPGEDNCLCVPCQRDRELSK